MASSKADSQSRLNLVVILTLKKIIKNTSWRKHSKLAHKSKSIIKTLNSPPKSLLSPASNSFDSPNNIPGPLHDGGQIELSLKESQSILNPLTTACELGFLKLPIQLMIKLIAHGYLRGEANPSGSAPKSKLLSRLIESVCKCHDLGDDNVELLVLKTLLSAITSISLRIHGLVIVIVFRRMEADSSTVPIQPIVVAELMEPAEKADADESMTMFVQGFITRIMQDLDIVLNLRTTRPSPTAHDGAFETTTTIETTNPADFLDSSDKDMLDAKNWEISMYKTALEGRKRELADGEVDKEDDLKVQIGNKLRRDVLLAKSENLSLKIPPSASRIGSKILSISITK
ncbi:LOW QUALITY PROTEIN: Mon2/Sec7/BIG1-like, dimerization and cyclophilin-binding domain [Dillenia turbinata]|uniref:Mon2/Sec7/BIG1-like, dimerization and cyclophilin-binding domain n=1 Tax=Dillenia turbinata TaxID=194707 RepID=A0AAN8WEF7_9MAGN